MDLSGIILGGGGQGKQLPYNTPIQVMGLKAVGENGGITLSIDPSTEASYPYLQDYWVVWKPTSQGPIEHPYDGQHMTFAKLPLVTGQDLANLAPGSTVKIMENNVPTQFLVLQHGYPASSDGNTLLLRKDIYDMRAWGASNNHWDGNSMDVFLNNEYLLLIEDGVRSQIPEIAMPYVPGNGDYTASTINRKVGLLTATELGISRNYTPVCGTAIPYFDSDLKRIAYYNGSAVRWWTMVPRSYESGYAEAIMESGNVPGSVNNFEISQLYGSRPKFCLPSTMQVSLEPDASGDYTLM